MRGRDEASGGGAWFVAEIGLCIALWYSASAVANTTSRKLLTEAPLPLLLTLSQFLCATAFGFVMLRVLRLRQYKPVPAEAQDTFRRLTFVYSMGFLFVNAGYVVVNVSLAETLRSAEPLVTVVLAKLFLQTEPVSRLEMLAMAPIVLGGALSSLGDSSFSMLGFLFVCLSNLSFSLRSMYTKQLKLVYDGDAFNVFYHVSALGATYLVAVVVVLEYAGTVLGPRPGPGAEGDDSSSSSSTSSAPGFLVMAHLEGLMTVDTMYCAMLNGVTYVLYNQTSFYVLSRTRMVTHGVANAFRRVITILASVWYFGNPINGINAFGIALAVSGVVLYAKAKDSAANAIADTKHSLPPR